MSSRLFYPILTNMLPIVQAPEPVLTQIAKPVGKIDQSIKTLISQMAETLVSATDPEGVGLAAPQVNKSLQLFIVKEDPEAKLRVFINPVIKSIFDAPKKPGASKAKKDKNGVKLEGCLSLNNIWGVVERHDAVILSYTDENGAKHEDRFDGFMATIIQHEVDHLQGILFTRRVLEQGNRLYKSVKDKDNETVFEEIEI